MAFNLSFLFYSLASLILFIPLFYIPGNLLVTKVFSNINGKIPLSFAIGISLWALQSYFFHSLNLPVLSWVYIATCSIVYIKTRFGKLVLHKPNIDFILFVIISLGSLFQLAAVFISGIKDSSGVWFYNINAYDGIYYLGLTKNLTSHFPPFEPGFANHYVLNYYYFSELIIADIARMFKLPDIILQFQIFPLLIAIVRGFLAYYLGLAFSQRKSVGRMFAFLTYFGSDFGYLTSLIFLNLPSVTILQPIDSANLLLTNMPRAFAEVIFLGGLLMLLEYLKEKRRFQFLTTGLVLISIVGFKIYYGIFSAILLSVIVLFEFIKTKKILNFFYLALIGLLGLAIYLPVNYGAGGLFWSPFSWPRNYFASGALQATQWQLKEQVYKAHNNNLRILVLNLQETLVFLVTIFGTRILGLIPFKKFRSTKFIYLLFYLPTLLFIFIGILFLQKNGLYNIFNFFSVAALILSLLTALLISVFEKMRKTFVTLVILIIVLTLPRPVENLLSQIHSAVAKQDAAYLIDNDELQALEYLKKHSPAKSVILAGPNNERDYYSPYIEYFSNRSTYLSNLNILQSHGQPTSSREAIVNSIFTSQNKPDFISKLKEQGIDFVYLKLPLNQQVNYQYTPQEIYFRNRAVLIIKVS